jgi:hypothetical protein
MRRFQIFLCFILVLMTGCAAQPKAPWWEASDFASRISTDGRNTGLNMAADNPGKICHSTEAVE